MAYNTLPQWGNGMAPLPLKGKALQASLGVGQIPNPVPGGGMNPGWGNWRVPKGGMPGVAPDGTPIPVNGDGDGHNAWRNQWIKPTNGQPVQWQPIPYNAPAVTKAGGTAVAPLPTLQQSLGAAPGSGIAPLPRITAPPAPPTWGPNATNAGGGSGLSESMQRAYNFTGGSISNPTPMRTSSGWQHSPGSGPTATLNANAALANMNAGQIGQSFGTGPGSGGGWGYGENGPQNNSFAGLPGGGSSGGGGGGGVSGGGGAATSQQGILGDLMSQYQQAMNAANSANQMRYEQGLGELQGLRDRGRQAVSGYGQQQVQDINQGAKNMQAEANQRAIQMGMAGTTVPQAAQRGIERERNASQARLGDYLARMNLDTDQRLTGNLTDWIFNRNDNAPKYSDLASLAMAYGNAGNGQASGGGLGGMMGGGGSPYQVPQQQMVSGMLPAQQQAMALQQMRAQQSLAQKANQPGWQQFTQVGPGAGATGGWSGGPSGSNDNLGGSGGSSDTIGGGGGVFGSLGNAFGNVFNGQNTARTNSNDWNEWIQAQMSGNPGGAYWSPAKVIGNQLGGYFNGLFT